MMVVLVMMVMMMIILTIMIVIGVFCDTVIAMKSYIWKYCKICG